MKTNPDSSALRIQVEDPVGETAQKLIEALCRELSERYGAPPSPFSPSEAAAPQTVFLVARRDGQPVGCGALRRLDNHLAEIKRMYVAPAGRRLGIARRILYELEGHAREFGYRAIRLETGIRQPEAQHLYTSMGFRRIDAFGPYVGNPTSICFEKVMHDLSSSPESVVQRQLDAYNARDIEALMATYADDAQQFEFPATLLASGAAEIRKRFEARFQEPNLHARLIRRIAMGDVVIDHEEVTRTFPEGTGKIELVAIYEVRVGKIATARFISGAKTLDR